MRLETIVQLIARGETKKEASTFRPAAKALHFSTKREVGRFAEAEYVFQVLYPNRSKKDGFDWEWQSKIKYWANKEAVGILAKLVSNHDDAFAYPYNEQGKDTSYSTWAPILRAKFTQNDALKAAFNVYGCQVFMGVRKRAKHRKKATRKHGAA